jgi:hypothetical protein
MVEVMEDTDLQMAAVEHQRHLVPSFDEGLPAHTGKVEGNLRREQGPGGVLIALNILERRDEGLVVRGTAEHQQAG